MALATFIVNDALRNEASDLSNAVRQARADYSVKKDVESVYDVAISIQVKLDDFEYRARKFANEATTPEPPDIQAWELVDVAQHEMPAIFTESAALSNAVDLNERLPYDQMLDKRTLDLNWLPKSLIRLPKRFETPSGHGPLYDSGSRVCWPQINRRAR